MKKSECKVGDIVEMVGDRYSFAVGLYCRKGDRGKVLSVSSDMPDLYIDFSKQGNSIVYGDGKWGVLIDDIKIVQPKRVRKPRAKAVKFEVGDLIEVVDKHHGGDTLFNVGDRARVLALCDDDFRADFNGRNNKRVVGAGKWYVYTYAVKLIQKATESK